jgi:hypothetical protein
VQNADFSVRAFVDVRLAVGEHDDAFSLKMLPKRGTQTRSIPGAGAGLLAKLLVECGNEAFDVTREWTERARLVVGDRLPEPVVPASPEKARRNQREHQCSDGKGDESCDHDIHRGRLAAGQEPEVVDDEDGAEQLLPGPEPDRTHLHALVTGVRRSDPRRPGRHFFALHPLQDGSTRKLGRISFRAREHASVGCAGRCEQDALVARQVAQAGREHFGFFLPVGDEALACRGDSQLRAQPQIGLEPLSRYLTEAEVTQDREKAESGHEPRQKECSTSHARNACHINRRGMAIGMVQADP